MIMQTKGINGLPRVSLTKQVYQASISLVFPMLNDHANKGNQWSIKRITYQTGLPGFYLSGISDVE